MHTCLWGEAFRDSKAQRTVAKKTKLISGKNLDRLNKQEIQKNKAVIGKETIEYSRNTTAKIIIPPLTCNLLTVTNVKFLFILLTLFWIKHEGWEKKKGSSREKKADREDDGIKQNSFLIKQSNKITVEKKAERNENLKAAEK